MANIDADGWNGGPYNDLGQIVWAFVPQNPGPTHQMTFDEVKDATAKTYFSLFFSDDVLDYTVEQTNLYRVQQATAHPNTHRTEWTPLTRNELSAWLGMSMMMGILRLPTYKLYFSSKSKLLQSGIRDVMSIKRFDQIKRYLHLADETTANPNDKLRKVRPFLDLVLPSFEREYILKQDNSIDEAMIPYKGRLNIKQYMKAKPTKWGIKAWCLNEASSGYGWRLQIYTGLAEDGAVEKDQAIRVVLDLMDGLDGKGYNLYTDNLYTCPILAMILHQRHIYTCGTVRTAPAPRKFFPHALVLTKPQIRRTERGDYEWLMNGPLLAMRWMDKKPVYLLSTIHPPHLRNGALPSVTRVARDGTATEVPCPPAEVDYVINMRGVDRADQMVGLYNSGRKSVKWWKRIFFYILEVSINNARILEEKQRQKYGLEPRPLLDFKIELAESLVAGRTYRKKAGRPSVDNIDIRLEDTGGHLPVMGDRQRDCKVCNKKIAHGDGGRGRKGNVRKRGEQNATYFTERHRTKIYCAICNVGLCVVTGRNCFYNYHKYKKYWLH
jgi:hypothetical protein